MNGPELPALRYEGFVDGIDVSAFQGSIDWQRVAEAGFRFAIVKVSEGEHGTDAKRSENLCGATSAGLTTLAYHFAHPRGAPAAQVEAMRRAIGDEAVARVALDFESTPAGFTRQGLVDWASGFADEAERVFGEPPLFYTYPAFASLMQPIPEALARCPLWIAHYLSTTVPWVPLPAFEPRVPKPWATWTIHQYSGNGGYRVPGIVTDCDRNLFHGDDEAFAALVSAAG
jgi:lysozyme